VPKSIKDVRAFLGFSGYYRRFIKGFAKIARPITDLLVGHSTAGKSKKKSERKKPPFIWTERQQRAFEEIKELLTQPPILAYADYDLPFKLHTDASTSGLGAVLYQNQNGKDRVVSYASRSLKDSEKNYPAHKLEFLALKWAITEKFHDYLYGSTFEVYTDNNPLTYIFSTAKLDATGQRWLAALSNYNCSLKYRSGKSNKDADGLSRKYEGETITTVFPDVLKAISQSVLVERDQRPFIESLVDGDDDTPLDEMSEEVIPDSVLTGTALTSQDWQNAQAADSDICFVTDHLLSGQKPTIKDAEHRDIDIQFVSDWNAYNLKDGVLYKSTSINGEKHDRLVLPDALKDIVFQAYHDDLGHQGRDRTVSLISNRFYFPRINQFIAEKVRNCGRCIRRKTTPLKAASLVNITSSAPMELVCIDYLSLETSKGGFENILVITDHFSRFAQAVPTRNQTAQTTAKALFENFFLHYGFPAKLHSDKGANFESKVIRKLCKLARITKTRTTPYHPMGNGMVERFNQTLLNMLGTLSNKQKSDWKSHVPTLTHAYNAAVHESTGFSPFFLMFGRHPRLAIDAFLGLSSTEERKSHQDYVDKLQQRLKIAYERAGEEARRKGKKYKRYYDQNVKFANLVSGDRVLVKKVGIKGKHKLADIWETNTYIVTSQPMPDIPVYLVKEENSSSKPKLLHRNMLLPFNGLPVTELSAENESRKRKETTEKDLVPVIFDSSESDSESNQDETSVKQQEVPRNVVPAKRGKDRQTNVSHDDTDSRASQEKKQRYIRKSKDEKESSRRNKQFRISDKNDQRRPRQSRRQQRKPRWMVSDEWQVQSKPHVFSVPAQQVVYI
ncbi:MAG: DDE-type integrase/transposase/recombinase, partial [Candidatus Thiodiazotropha taylori]|nr:DDE-type integrase/transposase/recombinase [Candidatus Thiodiazotropha taylori]MCW4335709.1 RNase H-like domain-containing protein [Candidatus Thiodiazotropha endolucinida]